MSRKLVIFAGALLCNVVVSGAIAAEPMTLRYGQNATSAGSLSSLPLTIAERKGLFVSKATGEFMRFALKQLAVAPNVKSNNHRGVVHESE